MYACHSDPGNECQGHGGSLKLDDCEQLHVFRAAYYRILLTNWLSLPQGYYLRTRVQVNIGIFYTLVMSSNRALDHQDNVYSSYSQYSLS